MRRFFPIARVVTLILAACLAATRGTDASEAAQASAPWLFASVNIGKAADGKVDNTVLKGLTLNLGGPAGASICYDLDLCRVAGAWTGGFATPQSLVPRIDAQAAGRLAFLGPTVAGFQSGSLQKQESATIAPALQGKAAASAADILTAEIGDLKRRLHDDPSPELERLLEAHEELLVRWNRAGGNREMPVWTDPRAEPYGPLPNVHYRGMYVNGGKVLLKWTVNGTDLFEAPEVSEHGGATEFTRHLRIGPMDREILVLVAEGELSKGQESKLPDAVGRGEPAASPGALSPGGLERRGPVEFSAKFSGKTGSCVLSGQTDGVVLTERDGAIYARVFPMGQERAFSIGLVIGSGPPKNPGPGSSAEPAAHALITPEFEAFFKGGTAQDPEMVTTHGETSAAKAEGYVVDTVALPMQNPWKARMHIGGFDFFADGRAAICTFDGDVFIVSGLDQNLEAVVWKRFASGLNQALGLKIVNGEIFVTCLDGITRLKDLNGDGEADEYERFNNDLEITANLREYVCDLQTDFDGNFYFTKGGPLNGEGTGFDKIVSQHGALMRLSPDGKDLKVFATGFRAPNGIGVGPESEFTAGDAAAPTDPASRLDWIQQGGCYGVPELSHWNPIPKEAEDPFCWLPNDVDNSPGGQVWAPPDPRWGPLRGSLLHTSYGKCALFVVLKEEISDQSRPACCTQLMQGGVVQFPMQFESGIMRARFNPADGQLYVAGLRGAETTAPADGCFQRVRYNGGAVRMPMALHARKDALEIRFACALDPREAGNPANWNLEVWNYPRKDHAESPKDSAVAEAHERLAIQRITVKDDDQAVVLELPGLRPVMQMSVSYRLKSADGAEFHGRIVNTVHALGP